MSVVKTVYRMCVFKVYVHVKTNGKGAVGMYMCTGLYDMLHEYSYIRYMLWWHCYVRLSKLHRSPNCLPIPNPVPVHSLLPTTSIVVAGLKFKNLSYALLLFLIESVSEMFKLSTLS